MKDIYYSYIITCLVIIDNMPIPLLEDNIKFLRAASLSSTLSSCIKTSCFAKQEYPIVLLGNDSTQFSSQYYNCSHTPTGTRYFDRHATDVTLCFDSRLPSSVIRCKNLISMQHVLSDPGKGHATCSLLCSQVVKVHLGTSYIPE